MIDIGAGHDIHHKKASSIVADTIGTQRGDAARCGRWQEGGACLHPGNGRAARVAVGRPLFYQQEVTVGDTVHPMLNHGFDLNIIPGLKGLFNAFLVLEDNFPPDTDQERRCFGNMLL